MDGRPWYLEGREMVMALADSVSGVPKLSFILNRFFFREGIGVSAPQKQIKVL